MDWWEVLRDAPWGGLADAAEALGWPVAVAIAVGALVAWLLRRRSETRAQARLIAAWFARKPDDPDSRVLHIHNGSDQPVRWVQVRSTAEEAEVVGMALLPPHHTEPRDAAGHLVVDEWEDYSADDLELIFTDAEGRRWRRRAGRQRWRRALSGGALHRYRWWHRPASVRATGSSEPD